MIARAARRVSDQLTARADRRVSHLLTVRSSAYRARRVIHLLTAQSSEYRARRGVIDSAVKRKPRTFSALRLLETLRGSLSLSNPAPNCTYTQLLPLQTPLRLPSWRLNPSRTPMWMMDCPRISCWRHCERAVSGWRPDLWR